MYVNPSTSFEAVAQFDTGLAGTLGVRIIDNAGATTLARQTAGIAEYPAGSGVYTVTLTSPGTAGQYTLVWDDAADNFATDELVVTAATTSVVIGSGNLYVTRDDLKEILRIQSTDHSDSAIDIAIDAASRAIDGYKDTRFYPTAETRYYTAGVYDSSIDIDDLVTLTSVTVDTDGDGSYETTWVEGTDFVLDPANSALEGRPTRRLVLITAPDLLPIGAEETLPTLVPRVRFPTYARAIKVAGTFGYATTPALVKQAAILLANRLLVRTKSAPLGILVAAAGESVATARLGRIDPDAAFLLDQLPGATRRLFV